MRPARPTTLVFLAVASCLLAARPTTALEPGLAELEVRVRDASGAPASGAGIRLSGTLELRAESRGDSARALFRALAPGAWRLEIDGAGSAPWSRELTLEPGERVIVEAQLESPAAGEPRAPARVIRYRPSVGTPIGAERLRELPQGRNVWSLLETFEPVSIVDRQDNGGLFTGEPGRVLVHGSSWTQTSFRIEGLDVTDPRGTGTPLLVPLVDAYESRDLSTALLPVETGGPGSLLTLQVRRPGERWSGSLRAGGLGDALQASNDRPGVPSIARFDSLLDAGAVVSGPLSERIGLLVAGGYTRSRRLERDQPALLEGETGGALAHLVYEPGPDRELRLLAGHQRSEIPFPGRARFVGDPDQRESFSHASLVWEHRPERGLAWSLSGGWLRGRTEPQLQGAAPRAVERLVEGPIRELALASDSTRERLGLELRLRPDLAGFDGGRHQLRVGASFYRSGVDTRPGPGLMPIPERVDGRAARVWDYAWAGPESRWRGTELAAWAADRVALGERLELQLGARFDFSSGSADGAEQGISWATLSPRLSFRQQLLRDRLVFFGGYARYRHRLPLDLLAHGDPAGPGGLVYRWSDADGDAVFDAGERGVLVARSGPGGPDVGAIDPDLRRPHTDEFVLGLEGRIARDFTVRFTAIARRERDLIESVNVGVGLDDYRVILVDDPAGDFDNPADDQQLPVYDRNPASFGRDRFLLQNPADHSSKHEGVEVVFEKHWGRAVWLLLGATAHRSEGLAGNIGFRPLENDQGVVGDLFDQPNADTFARGRLFSDRAYSINIAGGARLPGGFRVGGVARYQDGQNFARLVVADGLSQGTELVRATANGRHRFTFALTVDLKLEKSFSLGGARLAAVAEGFNVLNTNNDVEEDPVARPRFRNPTAVQPPAVLRLGLRLDF